MKKLIISTVVLGLLAGCASKQEPAVVETSKPTTVNEDTKPRTSTADTSGLNNNNTSNYGQTTAPAVVDPLNDPNNILSKRSVFHDFDASAVKEDDRPIVQAHAKYLSENSNKKVRLEGNCDERGSNEYNLALGQRRADGVKKMMELAGAKDSQLESVSYGEEKPRATEHDESAWSQNRRTDINYAR